MEDEGEIEDQQSDVSYDEGDGVQDPMDKYSMSISFVGKR
jgi:hypothetical protein